MLEEVDACVQAMPGATGLPQLPGSPQNRRMLAQEGAPAPAPQAEAPVMLKSLRTQSCQCTIQGNTIELGAACMNRLCNTIKRSDWVHH